RSRRRRVRGEAQVWRAVELQVRALTWLPPSVGAAGAEAQSRSIHFRWGPSRPDAENVTNLWPATLASAVLCTGSDRRRLTPPRPESGSHRPEEGGGVVRAPEDRPVPRRRIEVVHDLIGDRLVLAGRAEHLHDVRWRWLEGGVAPLGDGAGVRPD